MEEILPRTQKTIEDELNEMMKIKDQLEKECTLANNVLETFNQERETGSRSKSSGVIQLDPSSPLCDNYVFKVHTPDVVYCFETLDDLVSRIITSEEIENSTLSQGHRFCPSSSSSSSYSDAIECLRQYVSLRSNPRYSDSLEKCQKKLNKLAEDELETWALADNQIVNDFKRTISKFKNECLEEVDDLKELNEENYWERQVKEFEKHVEYIKLKIKSDLLEDIKGGKFPDELLPELYRTVSALQDITTLKLPVLLKNY